MKKFLCLIFIFISHMAYAKKIAIFLYVSEEQGNYIYDNYTKDLGFERKLSIGKFKDIEYHVTLGFIENVKTCDAKELKSKIYSELKPLINDISFKFGAASMLGKNIPYIVAIPLNIETFKNLNSQINKSLIEFKDNIYNLSEFTRSDYYIPHLSLNAKLFDDLNIVDLSETLIKVNNKMKDSKILLSKLVIKIE